MRSPSPFRLGPWAAAVLLALAPSRATAAPIAISGNGALGDYTGSFDYTFTSSTAGTVTVSLTNAATTAAGGKLTGFAFNVPTGATVTAVVYNAAGPNGTALTLVGGPGFNNSVPGNPFGDFDMGAALGGNLLGGGSPNPGLQIGQSGTYTFDLTGSGLDTLTPASFFAPTTVSSNPSAGQGAENFLARFRGFDNGGSDKVPGDVGQILPDSPPRGEPEVPTVPEPGTLAAVAALGGLGAFARRRRAA